MSEPHVGSLGLLFGFLPLSNLYRVLTLCKWPPLRTSVRLSNVELVNLGFTASWSVRQFADFPMPLPIRFEVSIDTEK
jgi:hypothetical protein